MKIDIHSHIEIPEAFELSGQGARAKAHSLSSGSATINERMYKVISGRLRDPAVKIADMERMGIDLALLSATPFSFFYNVDSKPAAELARLQNERIASLVRQYPARLAGLGTVPLQDVEASIAELDYAVRQLNLRGVEIGSNVQGRYLGHPDFAPFFKKAAELDVPILIHPCNVAGAERIEDYYFTNLIGNPLDTTITAAHLIFSGTLDRFPGLKIVLSHAGGHLPYLAGRLEHGWKVRPECREALKGSPAGYLRRFYYDTIAHSSRILSFLISSVGADRVLMGTDYPFDMADAEPERSVLSVAGLSSADVAGITGGNAAALFKIA